MGYCFDGKVSYSSVCRLGIFLPVVLNWPCAVDWMPVFTKWLSSFWVAHVQCCLFDWMPVFTKWLTSFWVAQVQCCFVTTVSIRTARDGVHRTATSTFTQLLSSVVTQRIFSFLFNRNPARIADTNPNRFSRSPNHNTGIDCSFILFLVSHWLYWAVETWWHSLTAYFRCMQRNRA